MTHWNNKGRSDLEAVILDRVKSMKAGEKKRFDTIYTNSIRRQYEGIFQTYYHTQQIKHQCAVVALMLKRIMTECIQDQTT